MKQIIITFLFLTAAVYQSQAQFRRLIEREKRRIEREKEKGPPNALQITGVSCIVVGSVVGVLAGDIYLVGSYEADNTFLVAAGAGGVMLIGGIVMLVVNSNHKRNHPYRWSVITPAGNEMGIAWNFR